MNTTKKFFLLFILMTLLLSSCLVRERAMTGVMVHNKTGQELQITVKYTTGEKNFNIHQQAETLIVEDFAQNGNSRSPQLREDLEAVFISYGENQQKIFSRDQLLKTAFWEKKSRRWILVVD